MASKKNLLEIWSQIVGRAWADKEFKAELLSNPNKVLKENGFPVALGDTYIVHETTDRDMYSIIHREENYFHPDPETRKWWKELADSEKMKMWNESGDPGQIKLWKKFADAVRKNPKIKAEFLTHPKETLKKFGLTQRKSHHIILEKENERHLVIPKPPEGVFSEEEIERLAAGSSCTDGYCTEACCA